MRNSILLDSSKKNSNKYKRFIERPKNDDESGYFRNKY